MPYSIEITSSAQRQFSRLSFQIQQNLSVKILTLEENPRPVGSKKLKPFDYYRLRVGDYRVIYSIDDHRAEIKILDLGHRKDIYR